MIAIDLEYQHTQIANKSWQRRRERELLNIIEQSVTWAFQPNGYGNVEVVMSCLVGRDLTTARIVANGSDEIAKRIERFLNSNQKVCARVVDASCPI